MRRERKLPLSQPIRLTAPLTRGAKGAVSAVATNLNLTNCLINGEHEDGKSRINS